MPMVDVGGKPSVRRMAVAQGRLVLSEKSLKAIRKGSVKKGDPLKVAEIAAITCVKKTAELIPYCHQIPVDHVKVEFEIKENSVACRCKVSATAKTGVEMEALAGVTAALLTVWDMVKYLEKDGRGQYPNTKITDVTVTLKEKDEP